MQEVRKGLVERTEDKVTEEQYGVPFVSLFHKQNLHSIGNSLPTIAFLLAMIVIFFDNFCNNIDKLLAIQPSKTLAIHPLKHWRSSLQKHWQSSL